MNIFGVQSHLYKKKIGGDPIVLFLVFQVERKTVMTAWRLYWGLRESDLLIECRFLKMIKMILIDV